MIFNRLQLFVLEKSISFSGCRGTRRDVSSILFAGLFLLAVMFPSPVRSQNTMVYNASSLMVGDNDVVREWTNGLSVAYLTNVNGYGNDGAFALIDKTTNTITLASFLSDARVYDFRVVDDSVFFCGSIFKNLQDRLLVGSFDINDVFNLGGSISYGVMSTPYHTPFGQSQVLRAWRMETYRNKAQESTHIVAVGGSYMNGGQYDCTTLLDAFYNGFQWEMYYYEDKDCDEYYTDITCTRRFVVASATHATNNHCYFRVFSKTYPFINFPVYPYQLIEVLRGTPTGKVLVESVGEDSIALAYYESLTASAGSTIQLFDLSSAPAMPTLLQSIYIQQDNTPAVSTIWRLRDIKYSPSQRVLMLLQTQRLPLSSTTVNAVSEYDLNNLSSLTYFASWLAGIRLFAIDKWGTNGYEAIGYGISHLLTLYDNYFSQVSSCNLTDTPNYIDDTPLVSLTTIFTHESHYHITLDTDNHTPVIDTEPLKIDCKE